MHAGEVRYRGAPLRGPLHRRARAGFGLITEGRSVFSQLSVATNLSLGRGSLSRALEMFPELEAAASRGVGIILVEQHARQALRFADRGYLMRRGRIEIEGTGQELLGRLGEIERSYLHADPGGTTD